MKTFLLVILSFFLNAFTLEILNNSPVIGILSQPSPYSENGYPSTNYSYIAGSYVQHLEAAGAQVIPIQWDMPPEELASLLSELNGVYFPGGGWDLNGTNGFTEFQEVGNFIVEQVIKINENGIYFPLMGVCLGYEMITLGVSQNSSLLVYIATGADVRKNLYPTADAPQSIMFENLDPDLYYNISHEDLAYFHHSYTPDPDSWTTNPYLKGNFTVTSWTNNTADTSYVATIEGIKYPIFGSQFHPEKNSFEWSTGEAIPHQADAIRLQQHMANFFVNQTRQNKNTMLGSTYQEKSIYNYLPIHLGVNPEFEDIYMIQNYNMTNPTTGTPRQRLKEYQKLTSMEKFFSVFFE